MNLASHTQTDSEVFVPIAIQFDNIKKSNIVLIKLTHKIINTTNTLLQSI